jgi:hypothetical protein
MAVLYSVTIVARAANGRFPRIPNTLNNAALPIVVLTVTVTSSQVRYGVALAAPP